MHNQNKVRPLRQSAFYADGLSARPIPPDTVARGGPGETIAPYDGLTLARTAVTAPPPVTMALLRRGRERFDIFCSPCHDRTGSGHGMIVRRGYKQPTSYHTERLRNVPIDYFVQVMVEGYGVMPSYAAQVPPEDRWAIAAYIRALQYSQNARLAELPEAQRPAVERELPR
jgi:mono/diheme cytochrome c family protein